MRALVKDEAHRVTPGADALVQAPNDGRAAAGHTELDS